MFEVSKQYLWKNLFLSIVRLIPMRNLFLSFFLNYCIQFRDIFFNIAWNAIIFRKCFIEELYKNSVCYTVTMYVKSYSKIRSIHSKCCLYTDCNPQCLLIRLFMFYSTIYEYYRNWNILNNLKYKKLYNCICFIVTQMETKRKLIWTIYFTGK